MPSPAIAVAVSVPKNATRVGIPRSIAVAATFAAGSTPSAGIPRSTKYWSR
jgi:hypothetical protein